MFLKSCAEKLPSFKNEENSLKNKENSFAFKKIFGSAMGAVSTSVLTMQFAFADSGKFGVWNNTTSIIGNLFQTLKDGLFSIVGPVVGAVLIICLITMALSGNQRHVESARQWAFRAFICLILVYAIPFILGLGQQIGESFIAGSP